MQTNIFHLIFIVFWCRLVWIRNQICTIFQLTVNEWQLHWLPSFRRFKNSSFFLFISLLTNGFYYYVISVVSNEVQQTVVKFRRYFTYNFFSSCIYFRIWTSCSNWPCTTNSIFCYSANQVEISENCNLIEFKYWNKGIHWLRGINLQ